MSKIVIGIYGASGFGKEVIPVVKNQLEKTTLAKDYLLVFVDDHPTQNMLNGYPVITYKQFLSHKSTKKYSVIAIANSKTRQSIAEKCLLDGVQPFTVQSQNTVILDGNLIGEGAIFCPFSMITSGAKVGKYFHANIYSYVAHDCVIGDYVTFAPSVKCNGNIVIEDHAYIGTGAIIKQGTPEEPLIIGKGAIVGMGAIVTKSVPPYTTVIGNPAKPLLKN